MIFRTASMLGYQPAQILQEMNQSMFPDLTRTEMFITAQVVQIDMERGTLISASAGHTEALRYQSSSGSIERLPTTGLPIGVDIASEMHQTEILLKPGDTVMLYSDGITEATNSEGELFGMDRLLELVHRFAHENAATIVKEIVEKIRVFSDNMPFADDLTLIALSARPRTLQREEFANFDSLNEICAFARNAVLSYGSECADAIELIVSELVTNSITHGDTAHENQVALRILLEAEKISLDFSSPGTRVETSESRLEIPDGLQEGGRGLLLVQDFADRVDYSHASGMNYWHIEKKVLEAHR
jgi:anti-sigma regulatory factor (Ser/Thr protein kinase)/ribosomal protein L18